MASSNKITNIYESYLQLSFIDKKNFNGRISPSVIVGSFIPCHHIRMFYMDTLLFLHIHASLYYELNHFLITENNNITLFKKLIDKLKIRFHDDLSNDNTHTNAIGKLSYSRNSDNNDFSGDVIFNFYVKNFILYYNTDFSNRGIAIDEEYISYIIRNNTNLDEKEEVNYRRYASIKPVLKNISRISNYTVGGRGSPTIEFRKPDQSILSNFLNSIEALEFTMNYTETSRVLMMIKVFNGIMDIGHENIMSYLLYYTIYYHIIVYNICIQNEINHFYLHHNPDVTKSVASSVTTSIRNYMIPSGGGSTPAQLDFETSPYNLISSNIKTLINNLRNNIGTLQSGYLGSGSAEYIENKTNYASKIEVLNDIKREFDKIQNDLNITIKDYNKYIKNFNNVKNYANFVIIVLIAIIIVTILITLLDSITPNFKSYYYIIAFIILSFITFIYYNKFQYINLYERFTDVYIPFTYSATLPPSTTFSPSNTPTPVAAANTSDGSEKCVSNTFTITNEQKYATARNSHKSFINSISVELNAYNETVNSLIKGLNTNLYTANYAVFAKDGNNYLYNLYVEKKNQNESNRIKKVALANMLDTMKRHIVYLFNLILLISLMTIVLLLGLILFNNFPFYLTYIIILCVILIIIIILYFIVTLIQPTRMLVNKNYWANKNPSRADLAKIY